MLHGPNLLLAGCVLLHLGLSNQYGLHAYYYNDQSLWQRIICKADCQSTTKFTKSFLLYGIFIFLSITTITTLNISYFVKIIHVANLLK